MAVALVAANRSSSLGLDVCCTKVCGVMRRTSGAGVDLHGCNGGCEDGLVGHCHSIDVDGTVARVHQSNGFSNSHCLGLSNSFNGTGSPDAGIAESGCITVAEYFGQRAGEHFGRGSGRDAGDRLQGTSTAGSIGDRSNCTCINAVQITRQSAQVCETIGCTAELKACGMHGML